MSSFFCYLLYTEEGHTYVGATTDPDRRLRQHRGEITGGAHATGIRVAQGLQWKRACVIEGIPEWRSALQIEWRWKHLSRHLPPPRPASALHRRLKALTLLLRMERPTQSAIPYDMYPDGPPVLRWDSEECRSTYDTYNAAE